MARTAWLIGLAAAVGGAAAAFAQDYNQWRGPGRNGVVPDSPKLAVGWGKDGPKKLWESEPIRGGNNGGFGCPAVAGDRVYVYANEKYDDPIPERVLAAGRLRGLGHFDTLPADDLVAAVEKARVSEERTAIKDGKQVKEWVNAWIEKQTPDAEARKKVAPFLADRLTRAGKALPLDLLAKLGAIKDRKFESQAALDRWFDENKIDAEARKTVMRAIPTTVPKGWDQLWCLDAATGKTAWKHQSPGAGGGWTSSSTPAVVGGKVYFAGSAGHAVCLDAATGKELWRTAANEKGGQINSSPLVADGVVVVLANPLVALDAETGSVLWRAAKVGGNGASPALWRSGETTRVVCNGSRGLVGLDLKTGEQKWSAPGGGLSSAAVSGDRAAVVGNNEKVGLAVYKLSADKAEPLWSQTSWADGATSPIIAGERLYVVTGKMAAAANLADGKVLWQHAEKTQGHTSPVLADGKIFVLVKGVLTVLDAGSAEYSELASAKLGALEYVSPAIAGGRLYLRGGKAVACYDLAPPANE